MTPEQQEAQARTRYFIITFSRIAGAALALFGIVIASGRFDSISAIAGYAMILVGLVDIALVPRALARKWRTPPTP